jgi:hypothetical protein
LLLRANSLISPPEYCSPHDLQPEICLTLKLRSEISRYTSWLGASHETFPVTELVLTIDGSIGCCHCRIPGVSLRNRKVLTHHKPLGLVTHIARQTASK